MSDCRLIPAMSAADYHRHPAISRSQLGWLATSPKYYKWRKSQPDESTPAMNAGSLLHAILLEPDAVEAGFAVRPSISRTTKEGKAAYADFLADLGDRTEVTQEQMDTAQAQAEAIRLHPIAGPTLAAPGRRELTCLWTHPSGIECRCRVDYLRDDGIVVDLKTARDITPYRFSAAAFDFGYHRQVTWYSDGLEACGIAVTGWVFVVVESTPPHDVIVYQPDEQMLAAARIELTDLMRVLAKCQREDRWPGIAEDAVMPLSLPRYALKDPDPV
jgi:hypothetical protein